MNEKESFNYKKGVRNMKLLGRNDCPYSRAAYVPIGYAQYDLPQVNLDEFRMIKFYGWIVAIPRNEPPKPILDTIAKYGPKAANYVRIGDVLVPDYLGPGNRLRVAYSI